MSWSKLPARFVASMLAGHLSVGLAASALLYILCLSGTLMVFHQEFARWEQPAVPEMATAEPAAVQRAARAALARTESTPRHFNIGLPVGGMPRLAVYTDEQGWYADAGGELVAPVDHGWTHFLEKLHYYLTLPGVWGLTLVGVLGVLMAALVVSGVLAHPRLFRDAFLLRLRGSSRVREADLHNRLSVWGAPFHFVIAVSGAALGLASIVAVAMAPVFNDGDTNAFFAPVFGAETEGSAEPAPLTDIGTALERFAVRHPDLQPWFVLMHDPATAGQSAEILAKHPRRLIYGDNYRFDAGGNLTGNLGLSDGPVGQQLVAAIYPLHFGSFGGLAVKLVYGVLGLLSCVVVASGINIWLLKRRQKGRAVPRLEAAWQAVVWGTPVALALVLILDAMADVGVAAGVAVFWPGLGALVGVRSLRPQGDWRAGLCLATAGLVVGSLAAQWVRSGVPLESPAAVGVSAALLGIAAVLAAAARSDRNAGGAGG